MFFPLKKLEGKKGKNGISNLIQKTTIKNKFFRFSFFFFEIPSDYSPVFFVFPVARHPARDSREEWQWTEAQGS